MSILTESAARMAGVERVAIWALTHILVTLALIEFEAAQARQQVQSANEHLRAVFDASPEALLLGVFRAA